MNATEKQLRAAYAQPLHALVVARGCWSPGFVAAMNGVQDETTMWSAGFKDGWANVVVALKNGDMWRGRARLLRGNLSQRWEDLQMKAPR